MGKIMDKKINILIASRYEKDQESILATLREQADFIITGMVKDESGAIIKTECLKPDIIILDLQLNAVNGLELVKIIRRRSPAAAIIVLCDNDEKNPETNPCPPAPAADFSMSSVEIFASLAMTAGISGFLLKEPDIVKLAHIVKFIFLGGCYINISIIEKVFRLVTFINQFHGQITEQKHIIFSPVERTVITLLAKGFSDSQIAKELNYSTGTIRNCITKIRCKTKLKSRIEIVTYALTSGLIRLEH